MIWLRWVMVFVVVLLAIGANMPDNMIARIGVDSTVLTVILAAIALTGVIAYRNLALVVAMVLLVIGANMPDGFMAGINLDRDVMLATLIALILAPFLQRHLES